MGQKIADNLTETKNWSGRNEVIETSGRLHPVWPQNKLFRTPWTADWMHTGQDRWIQTELAFTLCKECQQTESLWNHITTDHKEGEQLEDRRNFGESSCKSGDGTDQRVQSLMFMKMMNYPPPPRALLPLQSLAGSQNGTASDPLWCAIKYWYDMIRYDIIYLLTAIG